MPRIRSLPVLVTAFASFALFALLAFTPAASNLARAQSPAAETASEVMAADTPRSTAGGATFTAPAGWQLQRSDKLLTLQAPEGDLRVSLVELQAATADAAVAQAWALVQPTQAVRPLKLASLIAPRNGWLERKSYTYETSPNEHLVVAAQAWRAAAAWMVVVVQGNDGTRDKRASQLGIALGSLRPAGYQPETFASRKALPLDAVRIATLKAFLEGGMKQLAVPGVAFSLIDSGKVVFEGGLGVKTLGKPDPVDAHTLFIAASNTKAMTTLLLAQLVDEKKLRWDQAVAEADPRFKLGSAEITQRVQVKHLVCACTGMPRQDLEWIFEFKGKTPTDSLQLLAGMQPTSAFGEVFQYSNLMVSAAGYVAAGVIHPGVEPGAAYDKAMHERVFAPLGMNDTTFDFARALRGNVASPHGDDVDAQVRVMRMDLNYAIVPARPAGGVWTSAHDFSRFVMMELAGGVTEDGKRIVSTENLMARRAPQVKVGADITYGMGLFVDTRFGTPVIRHGGDLDGYHSDMIWLPEYNVGATILTNSDAGVDLRGPFLRKLLEVLFDGRPEADEQLRVAATLRLQEAAKERERLTLPPDPGVTARLAPRYSNAALGELAVRRERVGKSGRLVLDVGEWHSLAATRKNDDGSVSLITVEPGFGGFEFVVAERDGKRALVARDAQHEYVFMETAAKAIPRKKSAS